MNFYRFEVEWFSVFDDKPKIEKGFLKAENYADAAGQIEDAFKDETLLFDERIDKIDRVKEEIKKIFEMFDFY